MWARCCPWCACGQQIKALRTVCLGCAVSQQGERGSFSAHFQLLQWLCPARNSGKCPKPALPVVSWVLWPIFLTRWNLYYVISKMIATVYPLAECGLCARLGHMSEDIAIIPTRVDMPFWLMHDSKYCLLTQKALRKDGDNLHIQLHQSVSEIDKWLYNSLVFWLHVEYFSSHTVFINLWILITMLVISIIHLKSYYFYKAETVVLLTMHFTSQTLLMCLWYHCFSKIHFKCSYRSICWVAKSLHPSNSPLPLTVYSLDKFTTTFT